MGRPSRTRPWFLIAIACLTQATGCVPLPQRVRVVDGDTRQPIADPACTHVSVTDSLPILGWETSARLDSHPVHDGMIDARPGERDEYWKVGAEGYSERWFKLGRNGISVFNPGERSSGIFGFYDGEANAIRAGADGVVELPLKRQSWTWR